jgi:hypothetical protein
MSIVDTELEALASRPVIYRSLSEVAKRFPANKTDRPVHVATLTRWVLVGVKLSVGRRLKLRAVRFPGGWRTTDAWVEEFLSAITADRMGDDATLPETIRTPAKRRRELARVDRDLSKAGF